MACVDYGALLRVDGNFVNKNGDLFMESSDTGYVCEKAVDNDGTEYNIDGNYFVYAGDEQFLIVFYKGQYKVISNGNIIFTGWDMPFNSETHYFDGMPSIKVSRLNKDFQIEKLESWGTWEDYVKENWVGTSGNEKLSELREGTKRYKQFRRHAKKVAYVNKHGGIYKYRPYIFLAEWDYNEHHYEVIFGYGIEPSEEVYNEIKHESYGYTQVEIDYIDSWFNQL